ncbi:DUF502 domain-containing protein [Reichenbachiella versicolor]|uniref:DUF502 domain-containing protein n=1 Tax=Reichenbachiella versicolor TaxID=1821036 RepID=UPI000D6E9BC6|nr:DUF502 domain-containing protein [Reichenbachiella versicolor]
MTGLSDSTSTFLVGLFFILLCFGVGSFVQTQLGQVVYRKIEGSMIEKIPFYKVIKETVSQFFGKNKSPFSSVALVKVFGNDTMVTAFITDEHEDGSCTVFVPTGPNPTSGAIYHVKEENLTRLNANIDDTMRSIISCGAGSDRIMKQTPEKT